MGNVEEMDIWRTMSICVSVSFESFKYGHKNESSTNFFITGDEDMIQKDTYKLYGLFGENGIKCDIKNYPVGESHSLEHVFAIKYPDIPEAVEVRKFISDFWK